MKPITILEMITPQEQRFGGRYIDLTVIDDAEIKSGGGWLQLVVEDDDGDVGRLFVVTFEQIKTSIEGKLGFGSRIRVLDPIFMSFTSEQLSGIRVFEPKCIAYLDGVENMCRFCGEENANECKCSKCGRKYCSEDCIELDQSKMMHDLICYAV